MTFPCTEGRAEGQTAGYLEQYRQWYNATGFYVFDKEKQGLVGDGRTSIGELVPMHETNQGRQAEGSLRMAQQYG